MIENSENVKN
jgi:hypothetical protein